MSQDKYTRSAREQPCQVRIPGVCNHRPETTVFAHLNGGGMGRKKSSIHGAYACSDCHDVLDSRRGTMYTPQELRLFHLDAVIRTQEIMLKDGVLKL